MQSSVSNCEDLELDPICDMGPVKRPEDRGDVRPREKPRGSIRSCLQMIKGRRDDKR